MQETSVFTAARRLLFDSSGHGRDRYEPGQAYWASESTDDERTSVSTPSFHDMTARWMGIVGVFSTVLSGRNRPSANAHEADSENAENGASQ